MTKCLQNQDQKLSTNSNRPRIATNCICCESNKLSASPAVLMPFVAHRVFGWKPVEIDESWGLKTIKNGNAYSICNTLCCNNCGCIFLDIRFDENELSRLYQDYRGEDYVKLREFYEPGYYFRNEGLLGGINYISQIEDFIAPHLTVVDSILDWGGDTGQNTPFREARKRHVYDISPRPMVEGVEFVEKQTITHEKYDLVVCSNVLEHVSFPHEIIEDITRCMNEGTILYIEVPKEGIFQENCPQFYKIKRHWHEHINFFTEKSLLEITKRCGLEVIIISEINVSHRSESFEIFQLLCRLSRNL